MKLTHDSTADAAYMTLGDNIASGAVVQTLVVAGLPDAVAINIDLASDGRVLGIEFVGASALLGRSVLEGA